MDPATLLVADGPAVRQARVGPAVTVAFAPTKGDRPEWVVQKLTELGVDRIVPLRTARSVVRWEGERGRSAPCPSWAWWPSRPPPSADGPGFLRWVASPRWTAWRRRVAPSRCWPGPVAGPLTWGGRWWPWVPKEARDPAEEARFGPGVGLGPTVLRAETAAVAAGTLLCGLRSGLIGPACVTTLREGNYSGRQGLLLWEGRSMGTAVDGALWSVDSHAPASHWQSRSSGGDGCESGGKDVGDRQEC